MTAKQETKKGSFPATRSSRMALSGRSTDTELEIYRYDAFGNQWRGTQSDPFGYCGEYYDSESRLVYLRKRYYDSASGRFITEDPIKDGLDWYSYCGCEPVMGIDPSGLVNGETEELILALLRLTENKINYENYIHDRDFGTSYAGPCKCQVKMYKKGK